MNIGTFLARWLWFWRKPTPPVQAYRQVSIDDVIASFVRVLPPAPPCPGCGAHDWRGRPSNVRLWSLRTPQALSDEVVNRCRYCERWNGPGGDRP